jgi:NAD(P)-dependent dehydrogenase (short-subunit alcohol dehydrogenase family)
MSEIRFDGKVAIVTGAGGGLGRAYALELARRGAKVLVNDLGGAMDGTGGASDAADKVVDEIKAAGGEALANGASVTDDAGVAGMVKQAMDAWGRIDMLVANAGILRDKSFTKMEVADFEAVLNVHVMGAVKPIKAAWEIMKAQNYGRVVVTTSPTGLYGNFGQANYGTAKAGLVGFMLTMKIEGQKYDIRFNAICPMAATRMTTGMLPPEAEEKFSPARVAPGVVYLLSAEAPNGVVLVAGGGLFCLARLFETQGAYLGSGAISAEAVRDNWQRIADPAGQQFFAAAAEQGASIFRRLGGAS